MEDLFKSWTHWVAVAVEAAVVLVIALAVAEAVVRAIVIYFARPAASDAAKEGLRLRLARWLAVALEFALAADILRTVIAPSWEEIGKLAAIATLRTVLNYSLQREIEIAARHEERAAEVGTPHRPTRTP